MLIDKEYPATHSMSTSWFIAVLSIGNYLYTVIIRMNLSPMG